MSDVPVASTRVNAIVVPSGDQEGAQSSVEESFVRLTAPVPSAFITKMSKRLPTLRENAIFVPSGDHAGVPSNAASLVSCVWFVPSACMTQRSYSSPTMARTHTTSDPSGDQSG